MLHKKAISTCLVFSSLFLASCIKRPLTDEERNKMNCESLLVAIENKSVDEIYSLFAPSQFENNSDIKTSIDELITYYQGKHSSFIVKGFFVDGDIDKGDKVLNFHSSIDVTNENGNVYRLSTLWRTQDTTNDKNIGIWSLSIIKFADDPYPNYAYWGTGNEELGIHIGDIYVEA